MPTSRREREKEKARRTNAQEWAKSQERGGFEPTSVKLPKGFEMYKLEPGKHLVDFMPYRVGKGNPQADENFIHFERKFFIHRIPQPDGRSRPFCCSYRCFGKKCAVCQWLNQHGQTADKELVQQLRISDRHLWIINENPGKAKGPFKIFDSNHYNRGSGFGEMMVDAITSVPRYASFADLEGGWKVQLTVKEIPAGTFKYNGVTRIDFEARDYEYEEDILDKMPCLDDLLIETPFDEMEKMLEMGDEAPSSRNGKPDDDEEDEAPKTRKKVVDEEEEDEDEEEETPKARKKVKDDEDDDDEDEDDDKKEPTADEYGLEKGMYVTYKGVEYEISGISKDGTSLYLTDEDGNKPKGTVGPEDVKKVKTKSSKDTDDDEEDDEDDEESKPRKKGKAKAKAEEDEDDEDDESPLEKDEEDDEEDEEEEEDEDEPKTRKRKVKG